MMQMQSFFESSDPSRALRDENQFKKIAFLLFVVTAIGLLLRLCGLGAQSLWIDEVASVGNAGAFGNGGMTELAAADHVAPLHSMLLWLVMVVSAPTEAAVRMPSAIFGAAVVPVVGWLVYDMFRDTRLAVVSSLIMCCSPFAIWYSQEARMYSLFLFFSVVFVALSWRAAERPLGQALWISLVGVSTLGLYTHHFMALLIVAFGLYCAGRLGIVSVRLWWWASTQALAIVFFLYWMYLTFEHLDAGAGMPKPTFALWIPYTLFAFSFGPTLGPSVAEIRETGIGWLLSYQGPLVGVAALCAAYLMYRGLREILKKEETRQAGIWCVIWLTVPVLLAIVVTTITNITYHPRYVIVSLPPLVIILAAGLTSILRSGTAALGAVVTFVILTSIGLGNLYWNSAYAREDIRPVGRMLRADLGSRDTLVVANSNMFLVLQYYGVDVPSQALLLDPRGAQAAPDLRDAIAQLEQAMKRPDANVWLVEYRFWEVDPGHVLRATLDRLGQVKETHSWPGVSLRIYGPGSSSAKSD
jgi:4-amino-4-deoxy-L-arabinose transferase-like glycosyltransferase